jgi:hypothetical protein
MELIKVRIWIVMRWEPNDDDVEVNRVINAYTTKEEAVVRCEKYRKTNDGLKYVVRSVNTWFPK